MRRGLMERLRRLFTPSARVEPAPPPWSRQRLLLVLGALVVVAAVGVFGFGLAVYYAVGAGRHHSAGGGSTRTGSASTVAGVHPRSSAAPSGTASGSGVGSPTGASAGGVAAQDRLAAAPMPKATLTDAQPGAPISTKDPGALAVPQSTKRDSLGVATGFPHTPAGALAAMASIDSAAFNTGSMNGVRSVIRVWAVPGGPSTSSWSGVKGMAEFFDAAGLSGAGSQTLSMVMTPVMGLIKGTVGTDFVVPCVDFELDATLNQTQRVTVADCERMVWTGGKWMIGAGAEPADPPSVWPDTDLAIKVGYQDLGR